MERKMKAGDILAKADFRLLGTGWDGRLVDEIVHAELAVSGASPYGNQTCMAIMWKNDQIESFDTRYEKVTPETFTEFARSVLDARTLKTINVIPTDES